MPFQSASLMFDNSEAVSMGVPGKSGPAHADPDFKEGNTIMGAKEIIKAVSINCTRVDINGLPFF